MKLAIHRIARLRAGKCGNLNSKNIATVDPGIIELKFPEAASTKYMSVPANEGGNNRDHVRFYRIPE